MKLRCVLLFLLISVFSCRNGYHDWEDFFAKKESSDNNTSPISSLLLSEKFRDQLKFAIYTNAININVQNETFIDKKINKFVTAKKYYADEDYQKVIDICLPLKAECIKTQDIDLQILYHEANLLLLDALAYTIDISLAKSSIREGNGQLHFLSPILNTYYRVRYILPQVKIDNVISYNKRALAACHYAAYLIKRDIPSFTSLSLQVDMLNITSHYNAGEKHLDLLEQKLLTLHSAYTGNIEGIARVRSNLINYYAIKKNDTKADSIAEVALKEIDQLSAEQKNYVLISVIFHYNISKNGLYKNKANALFAKFGSKNDHTCTKNHYVFRLYEVRSYIQAGRYQKADSLLTTITVPELCHKRLQNQITYYYLNTKLSLLTLQYPNSLLKERIDLLLYNRSLASSLFVGEEELHLEDLYAKNQNQFFEFLASFHKNKIPDNFHTKVIEILDDTRKRDWNRELVSNLVDADLQSGTPLDAVNIRIREGLRRCNDFLRTDSLDASFYMDLFQAYMDKDSLVSTMSLVSPDYTPIKSSVLAQKLEMNDAQILQFFAIKSNFWAVLYDGKTMQLQRYDKVEIDSLCNQYLNELKNKDLKYETSKSIFSKISIFRQLNKSKKLYVLTDGMLSQIPYDNLDMDVYIMPTLDAIINDESQSLTANEITILTFSDAQTRKNTKPQEIGELYHDYEEGSEIHSILKGLPLFYHGSASTVESFNASMAGKALHISTHAFGDKTNRLNSHLYLRNQTTGQPQKVYMSNIYGFKKTPLFVNMSTCVSGIGTDVDGQGMYALSRPFFTKGSQTVIKTLWEIDDKASREFMKLFYTSWYGGMTVHTALISTKKQLKSSEKFNHPYYWAAYVLEGNPNLVLHTK